MKRLLCASAALLSGGCVLRPWTPSVSVAYGAQEVPAPTAIQVAPAPELVRRWQLPAGSPWAAYAKYTLLTSMQDPRRVQSLPEVRNLEVVRRAERAASVLSAAGLPSDALWIVDMRGAASVAFGATLSQRAPEPVAPVVTFNNWPAQDGMIPAEETLAALITMSPRMPGSTETSAVPVFLLDAWRLAWREDEPAYDVTDNRYMLDAASFPSADELRGRNIRHVLYVVESLDDAEYEEDDVHASARSWQAAGITFHMVDLATLERLERPVNWEALLEDFRLQVVARDTIVLDTTFYARSQGGFGGTHGTPSPFRYGGSYRGTGHGGGG
jgi:hypothetical protein